MRTHIKIESQLRVHIDCMYDKLEDITKDNRTAIAKNDAIILSNIQQIHHLKTSIEKDQAEKKEFERDRLYKKVGQLQIEVDWLKKKTGYLG